MRRAGGVAWRLFLRRSTIIITVFVIIIGIMIGLMDTLFSLVLIKWLGQVFG